MQSLLLGLFIQLIGVYTADLNKLNVWPMPKSVVYGHQSLYLSKNFELKNEGTKYADASGILKEGFLRLLEVIKTGHVIDSNFSQFDPLALLHGIHVIVSSPSDEVLMYIACIGFIVAVFGVVYFCTVPKYFD